jgi:hypothetical protein
MKPPLWLFIVIYGCFWIALNGLFIQFVTPDRPALGGTMANIVIIAINVLIGIPCAMCGWAPWRDRDECLTPSPAPRRSA